MAGFGGLVGATLAPVDVGATSHDVDAHTRQTYRSIADAAIPRTPDLGPVQEPGALDVGLEEFVIYQLTFGQTVPPAWQRDGSLAEEWESSYPASENALEGLIATLESQAGFSVQEDFGLSPDAVFGALEGLEVSLNTFGGVDLTVTETGGSATTQSMDELPIATLYAATLDLYALFFVAAGANQGEIGPTQEFQGGGFFTFLAPADRMQCLLFITTEDGQAIDGPGSAFLPGKLLAKKLVRSVLIANQQGYYTEWAGYGSTRTNDPNNRTLELDYTEIQGWQQIGYDGPVKGRTGYFDGPFEEFNRNDWGENA